MVCPLFKQREQKLEICLPKNQYTQRKLLNFENWCNGEASKIEYLFRKSSDLKVAIIKNISNNKCAPKLVFCNELKIEKYSDIKTNFES